MEKTSTIARLPVEAIIYVILFLLCLGFSIISITEFTARDDFKGYLDGRIQEQKNLLVAAAAKDSVAVEEKLHFLSIQKNRLESLVKFGIGRSGNTIGEMREAVSLTIDGDTHSSKPFAPFWSPILKFSNEHLMVFTTIICGLIGAIISSLIARRSVKISRIGIGISAAFVSYILIKSGKFIFLISDVKDLNPLNPYTLALLGLVAGLYSDKFFKVLQEKIAKATDKTESSQGDTGKS